MTIPPARPAPTPSGTSADPTPVLEGAQADLPSVIALAQQLIQTPSRSGRDPYEAIISRLEAWFAEHMLTTRRLLDADGQVVGLGADISGAKPGSWYVLDACIDTPPFGDEGAWTLPPSSGAVVDGWLHGRGAADCKTAAAIFAHLGRRLRQQADQLHGGVTLLFDADEHTGRFGGIKQFLDSSANRSQIAGFLIGYPGPDEIVIGGRGFLRAEVTVHGVAGHSGSSRPAAGNAVEKAAMLVGLLTSQPLPGENGSGFPVDPKLTVTAISGGEPDGGYSLVPDHCVVYVDIRLTPSFDAAAATRLLERTRHELDQRWPNVEATELRFEESWPPYQLPDDATLSRALVDAVEQVAGVRPRLKVAGPSNIGNYLATLGIPATAGYGLRYEGLHGTNERIEIASIPTTQAAYHRAITQLLGVDQSS